jgi:hypothetical protein
LPLAFTPEDDADYTVERPTRPIDPDPPEWILSPKPRHARLVPLGQAEVRIVRSELIAAELEGRSTQTASEQLQSTGSLPATNRPPAVRSKTARRSAATTRRTASPFRLLCQSDKAVGRVTTMIRSGRSR